MTRHIAAVAVALCLSSSPVSAQIAEPQTLALTVKTPANVHKSPTTASPVIGKASRGTVLEITRNLGSWVQVPWADGEKGLAYVHVSAGTIASAVAPPANRVSATSALQPAATAAPASAAPLAAAAPAEQATIAGRQSGSASEYVTLPRHVVGLGGRMSAAGPGFGGTARTWWRNRLGLQFEMSRDRFDAIGTTGHVTSFQFAPSLLYSLPDGVMSGLWLRPYVGGGGAFYRASVSDPAVSATSLAAEKGMGFQTFGGAEATFAGVPRFALSADVGYRWSHTALGGLEPDKIGFSLSGHWYVK
jgi:hypothetical protein